MQMILGLTMLSLVVVASAAAPEGSAKKAEGSAMKSVDKAQEQMDAEMAKKGLYRLPLKMPKAMFIGTPKNIKSPNLRKETGKKRPPFYAPKGAKNVALGKEISGSDEEPIIGELELITDGDKEGGDGSFVEFGPGVQHVQIDLGAKFEIWAILVWHYHSEGRVYQDMVVQTADDPDFIMGIKTLFNNDHDNSSGLGVGKTDKEYIETNDAYLISGLDRKTKKPAVSQYVRMYSNGNTSNELNHYIEIEVWGVPAKTK